MAAMTAMSLLAGATSSPQVLEPNLHKKQLTKTNVVTANALF